MCLCRSEVANAAGDSTFRIFDWAGRVSWNKQDKQLDHCSAQLTNANGITIVYSLDRHYVWGLEFSSPTWNFTKGASFPLNLKVGDHGYFRFRAVASETNLVHLELPDSLAVFDSLRRAIQVGFAAGGMTSGFDLTYGPQVLMALTKCVARYETSQRYHKEVAAWLKTFPTAKPGTADDAGVRKEAGALAANVMTEARIPNAASLPQADVPPGVAGDAFWKVGNIIFSVAILQQQDMASFGTLPDLIIGAESIKCRGDLFSGGMIDVIGKTQAARVITNCVTPQTNSTNYYLVIPRKRGGVYILTTELRGFEIAVPGAPTAEEIDDRVRGSINVAVAQLAEMK